MKLKKIFIYLALAAVLTAGAGCSRARNIPVKDLKEIFKDAFLVNAYYQTNPILMRSMTVDSLDIYRPILQRYGYRLRDLEYTVHQISKQKSQNLSDIIELSIAELKKESEYLDQRVGVLDSVDARSSRMLMKTVIYEEQIAAREIRDTSRLRITVPVEAGIYELSYAYLVDSLDQNGGLRFTGTVYDTLGRRRNVTSQSLSKKQQKRAPTQRFETTAADSALVLLVGTYSSEMKRPHITIDSLKLVYYPPKEVAVDSVMKTFYQINFAPYYDGQKQAAQDSSTLRADTLRIDASGIGDGRP